MRLSLHVDNPKQKSRSKTIGVGKGLRQITGKLVMDILTLFQVGEGPFDPSPISIRHNFFLVIAMKLKFSIASQLLIRKILPKYF